MFRNKCNVSSSSAVPLRTSASDAVGSTSPLAFTRTVGSFSIGVSNVDG